MGGEAIISVVRKWLLKKYLFFLGREKYYLVTQPGYRELSNVRITKEFPKPTLEIDHRLFEHDKLVIQTGIALENQKSATCWISDLRLRSNSELAGGLRSFNVPDGIYLSSDGRKVALDLERSKKTKEVYLKKISKYVFMIRSDKVSVRVFDKVLYVCGKEHVASFLKQNTKIYGDIFEVKMFTEFFGEKYGNPDGPAGP